MIYYVYVLLSEKDGKRYIGYTQNLNLRFSQHNKGLVRSTKGRRPFKLVYFEEFSNKSDALNREKFFKTGKGREFLKEKLKN